MPLASLPSPCYVISDAHVGIDAAGTDAEHALLAFLDACRVGSLVIDGDLFDFWFEWRRVIPRAGFRVLAALASLRERGIPVLWVAGNHDCWGGDVLRRDVGVEYVFGPWEGTVAGWRAHIEHGDGLRGPEDRGYRAFGRSCAIRWPSARFVGCRPIYPVDSRRAARTPAAPIAPVTRARASAPSPWGS